MEEFMMWYARLIRRLGKPVLPDEELADIRVSKSPHIWIRWRICTWILLFECANITYGYGVLITRHRDSAEFINLLTNGVWLVCVFNIISFMVCIHRNPVATISQIFRKWDEVRREYEAVLTPTELFKVDRKERRKIKLILGIYSYSITVTAMGVANHFLSFSRTDIYLFNRFGFDEATRNSSVKFLFIPHEFGWMILGVGVQFAPEVFLLLLAGRIIIAMQALEKVELGEAIERYKNLATTLRLINETFKLWVERLQYVLVFYVSLVVFTLVSSFSELPFLAQVMFAANGMAGTFRNTMLLTPMGQVNERSKNLIKSFNAKEGNSYYRKQILTLRDLQFKNGNYYFVDSCSALHFVTCVISQVIFLLNT